LKTRIMRYSGLLIVVLFVFALFPQSAATDEWSEYFEGDMDGWTVQSGNWTVTPDGTLEVNYLFQDVRNRIWHNSSLYEGAWSFDVYHPDADTYYKTTIFFIANETESGLIYGYVIQFDVNTISLLRRMGSNTANYWLGSIETEGLENTWTSIDVSRNSTGGFDVYVNATSFPTDPDFSAVDTEYNYSERFILEARVPVEGAQFDNIVVDDEPIERAQINDHTTPTTPTGTTPTGVGTPLDMTLLFVGGGVAGVVIIVAVVFMRRR